MRRKDVYITTLLAVALWTSYAQAAVDGFPLYRTIDPTPDPRSNPHVLDMNAKDQIVGHEIGANDTKVAVGFRWSSPDKVDVVRDFRSGYWATELVAISDDGTAVGHGYMSAAGDRFMKRALLMRPNGVRVALPHPGSPNEHSEAIDVSAAGAVGRVTSSDGWHLYSVRWFADGSWERIDLPGEVVAINDRGDIVSDYDHETSRMLTASGERHVIPFSQVLTLNDGGVVAGRINAPSARGGAIWSVEGGLEVLPRPTQLPQASCYAQSVNKRGQVVGHCDPTLGDSRALTWLKIDGVWQIADLAWQVPDGTLDPKRWHNALRINDRGHILVDGAVGVKILVPFKKD